MLTINVRQVGRAEEQKMMVRHQLDYHQLGFRIYLIVFIVVCLAGCTAHSVPLPDLADTLPPSPSPGQFTADLSPDSNAELAEEVSWPDPEWPLVAPEDVGMDGDRLSDMMQAIDAHGIAVDGVVIIRHGQLAFEAYRHGFDEDEKHHLQSATKSVSSVLVGIAYEQGLIESVHQKMVDFFLEYDLSPQDTRKGEITLEHLLTMSEGLDWHELDYPYTDTRNSLGQMWQSTDAIQHVLNQAMAREPGQEWAYNSGTSILLGGIVEEAAGQDVLSFARKYLFEPLGIEDYMWSKARGNHYHTDGGLYLTPRDMAKLGYLMLHKGEWKGETILSPEWVSASTQTHYQLSADRGYGYQWWTDPGSNLFWAHGHYDQWILVVPEVDMVVVFTGSIPDDAPHPVLTILYRYILPAVEDLPQTMLTRTYMNDDWRFDHPAEFTVVFTAEAEATVGGKRVILLHDWYPLEIIQVHWMPVDPAMTIEQLLATLATDLQAEGVTLGDLQYSNLQVDDHEVSLIPFQAEPGSMNIKGMLASWYCDVDRQRYLFFTGAAGVSSDEGRLRTIENHLANFHDHEPQVKGE